MKYRFVDLSLPIEASISEPEPVKIERIDHREGAFLLTQGSGLHADHFPDGLGLSLERIELTSHSGTHVDAPVHYGPLSEGKKARSIDEMPLEWFFGPAMVLDCQSEASSEVVACSDLKYAAFKQGLALEAGDLVFIHTGADSLWGTPEYFTSFRGMSVSAVEWLLDQGIRVIGVDSFGFDAPFARMIEAYKREKDERALWPCHVLGRSREYCQIERLANLSALPKHKKFLASCFPIKLKGCGAGPSRVVALLEENHG